MKAAIVAVTYLVSILIGVLLGLWVAALQVVQCPPGLSIGICFPVQRFSTWEAGLAGLAGATAVLACGIASDRLAARRRRL